MPRLLSESAVYGIGGVANQALNIFLVPIYARQLGTQGYGVVAIVGATLSLSTMFATLALPTAFFRWYLKESETGADQDRVVAVSNSLRVASSLLFLLLFSAVALPLTLLLFSGSASQFPVVALIGPIVFFDTLNLMPLSYLRAQRRPQAYVTITFTRAILGSLLIIGFVVGFGYGVLGVVLGSVISAVVAGAMGLIAMRRLHRIHLDWDWKLVRSMLAFSLPLVPASFAAWGLNLSDRYVIRAVDGFSAAGIYSSGYTAGLVITAIAIAPFTLAWGAAYWELARRPDATRVFSRVLTIFTVVACGLALALSAVGTDAIRILLGARFDTARFVVPFSAFGGVLYGHYYIVTTGINLESKTKVLPITMGAAAIGNLLLNLVLVPIFGFMGAAYSTLISYAQLTISSGIVSQRYYRVPWDYPRVLSAFLIALGLAAAALLGPDNALWRLGVLLVYPLLMRLLRVVRAADLAAVRELVGSRIAVGRR
jgi:O-antigen/teichoic acid export membrane protein